MSTIVRFETCYEEPYPLEVQGESHYRTNLETVSGHTGEDEGVDIDDAIAHLILEDNNVEDPNAVRVEIRGKRVGYLAKSAAKKYRKRLIALGLSNVVGECYASIRGGHVLPNGMTAYFGVRLDLDLETFKPYVPRQTVVTPAPAIPVPEPKPIQPIPADPIVTAPNPPKSFLPNFLSWFFRPGKYRILRIISFISLVIMLCFACTICFGIFLQMTGQ